MKNLHRVAFVLLLLGGALIGQAQTVNDSLAIVSAQWEVKTIGKGIVSRCAAFQELYHGPQYVSIIEVNTKQRHRAGIAFSREMKTMTRLAQEQKAIAAINGSYFDMQKGNSVTFLKVDRAVVDSTEESEFKNRVSGAVAVRKGKLRVVPWTRQIEHGYKKKTGVVLASGPLMLYHNRYADWSKCNEDFVQTKHPRSAVVVTKDRKVLLITVDGRAKGHAIGMSIPELAHLIKVLGGKDALNLDGGGSTTLYLNGEILNHPTDNGRFDHEGERIIPNIIYFR